MKKVRFLVATAASLMAFQHHVKAALPQDPMLIVGNKAYYYNDISIKATEINSQIFNNPSKIYYGDGTKIVDIFTNNTVPESQLNILTGNTIYYYKNGTTTTYIAGSDGIYNQVTSSCFATVQVTVTKVVGSLSVLTTKITGINGVPGAAYYKVYESGLKGMNDSIMTSVQSTGSIPIQIYPDDTSSFIATGNFTLPTITAGNSATATINVPLTSYITTNPTTSRGNLGQGNMSNTGFVAADDNYIYYSNSADNGKIYKMSPSGLDNYIICDDNAKYITVVGGWIYYSNYSKTDGGKIYKVKTDGTKRQKVSDNVGTFLNAVGDKVYYSNASDGGKLYVLDSMGNSTPLCNNRADYISISGGNTILYSNASDGRKLYSIGLDGTYNLPTSNTQGNMKYINASDSASVYYCTDEGKVYKRGDLYPISIKLVTKDKNGNSSVPIDDTATNINVSGSNIYYRSLSDGNKIYKVGTNGGVSEKVTDLAAEAINIYVQNADDVNNRKDIVYFTQSGGKLYKVLDPVTNVDKSGNTTYTLQTAAVTKPKSTVTIKSVSNINISVDDSDVGKEVKDLDLDKYLQDRVPATMSDNYVRQLVVNWDKTNFTNKSGICTFTGSIVGYGKNITLSLTLASLGINSNYIEVTNNIGKNDTLVTLDGAKLSSGDMIKVYDSLTSTKPLAQQKADSNGKVSIAGLDLAKNGGVLYVSVTRGTQSESRRTAVTYGVELPTAPSGVSIDLSSVKTQAGDTTTDVIINNLLVKSSTSSVSIGSLQYRSAAIDVTGKTATVGESDWKDVVSTGVINDSLAIGKGGAQIQFRTKASGTTPASAPTTAIVISPRGAAPSGIRFDEQTSISDATKNKETISGTTTSMEYSLDGTNWITATLGTTVIDNVDPDTPIKVRKKSTISALPTIEAVQIKITNPNKQYSVSAGINTLELNSTTPVTWSVSDEDAINGTPTTKATITSDDSTPTKATLKGLENGRVKVWATAKDGTGIQGYVIITIGAQSSITVSNDTQLAAALADITVGDIKLLSRVYTMNNFDVNRPLIIEGTGNMSQIKANNLNSTGSFITSSSSSLMLKNLVIDGNTQNVSSVINSANSLYLDGVSFTNIKNDNGTSIGINQTSNALTVKNSTFDATNSMNKVINFNSNSTSTENKITSSNFYANSSTVNGYQDAIYQSNGTLQITGNSFRNYNHYVTSSEIVPQIGRADSAVAVTGGTSRIGGTGLLQANNFDNCVTSVLTSGGIVTNNNVTPTSDLLNGNNNVSNPVLFNGKLINPGAISTAITAPVIKTGLNPLQGGALNALQDIIDIAVTSSLPSGGAYVIPASWNYSTEAQIKQYMTTDNGVQFTDLTTAKALPKQTGDYKVVFIDSNSNVQVQSAGSFKIDSTKPVLQSAVINNAAKNNIVLTYNEALNITAISTEPVVNTDPKNFEIFGAPASTNITGVTVSGSVVTIALDKDIPYGNSVSVKYNKTGTNNIKDLAGNLADTFNQTVTNGVVGVNPPDLTAASGKTTADDIVITFTNDDNWKSNITAIKDAATNTDIKASCIIPTGAGAQSGKITIPAGTFKTAGVHSLTISSTGYNDATIVQPVYAAISSITTSANDASYNVGKVIPITVNFNGNVTVTGTPRLKINSGAGGADLYVNYTSGSGTSALTFNYTVGSGEISPDLDVNSINLNGGTITSAVGSLTSNASITLPDPTKPAELPNTLAGAKNIVIDTTAPTAATTGSITANGLSTGNTITIKFSEKVKSNNVTSTLTLSNSHSFGSTGATVLPNTPGADYDNTFNITLGTAGVTVAANDVITITAANVVDQAGNTPGAPITFTVPTVTDTTPPSIPVSNATNGFTLTAGSVNNGTNGDKDNVVVGSTGSALSENITLEYKVSATDPGASATADGSTTVTTIVGANTTIFGDIVIPNIATDHIWVRAVDTAGNKSAWVDLGADK